MRPWLPAALIAFPWWQARPAMALTWISPAATLFRQQAGAELAQPTGVQQHQFAGFQRDQALAAEAPQHPAHRFRGQPQVVRDVAARHAEVEARGGEATCRVAVGEVDQEGGHALIRTVV